MIRQYIYALDIAERREEVSQLFQVFILIGNARNEDVANPYRLVDFAEIAGTIEYVLVAMKRQLTMLFLKEFSFFLKWLRRGIKTGIDATLMRFLKQFDEKVYLHQGFSTAHGNTALISPITLESLCLVQKVISTPLFSYPRLPRIRVVAELAAHRTPLQKNQKTDAWSIYRTKALYTVNKSFMHSFEDHILPTMQKDS